MIEALGAGNAVLAHNNKFNRWVAKQGAVYFNDEADCELLLEQLLEDDAKLAKMRLASQQRFKNHFTWPQVLADYAHLLETWLPATR